MDTYFVLIQETVKTFERYFEIINVAISLVIIVLLVFGMHNIRTLGGVLGKSLKYLVASAIFFAVFEIIHAVEEFTPLKIGVGEIAEILMALFFLLAVLKIRQVFNLSSKNQ